VRAKSITLEEELAIALSRDDLAAIISALEKRGSGSAAIGADPGTAPVPDKRLAAKMIRAYLKDQTSELFAWCKNLLRRSDYNAIEVGLTLLPGVYSRDPKFAQRQLLLQAGSLNWEVREFAGSVAAEILDQHFDEFYPVLKKWAAHSSENVRRAVVIATMQAAKANRPKRGAKLLKLLDPLMKDEARYVRVNLGQFAISLALLKNYPKLTLKWLNKHSLTQNEFARWNVAMVWSAVGGRLYAKEGARLLHRLAADERRFVWRAVAAATVKLGAAMPEVVRPLLKKWRSDPKRSHVAEVVNRYL
jgi:3-methyladenine DNA glycosylase AlkC